MAHREWEAELDKARKSSTRRQAYDLKASHEYEAKVESKRQGKLAEIHNWSAKDRDEWEKRYEAEWKPPPGVKASARAAARCPRARQRAPASA